MNTTLGIQGISGYQLRIQSMSSKLTELTKLGDSSSISIASSIKQQLTDVKSQLYTTKQSNERILFSGYDKKGTITINEDTSSFDAQA